MSVCKCGDLGTLRPAEAAVHVLCPRSHERQRGWPPAHFIQDSELFHSGFGIRLKLQAIYD